MATVAECAKHLDMTERNLLALIAAGKVTRQPGRGKYDLDTVRIEYIQHLRRLAGGHEVGAPVRSEMEEQHEAEKLRWQRARADQAELNLAERKGELIPAQQVADALNAAVINMKTRLLAIPSSVAPQVSALRKVPEIEGLLGDAIREGLREIAETEITATKSGNSQPD